MATTKTNWFKLSLILLAALLLSACGQTAEKADQGSSSVPPATSTPAIISTPAVTSTADSTSSEQDQVPEAIETYTDKKAGWEMPEEFILDQITMSGTEYTQEVLKEHLTANRGYYLEKINNMGIYEGTDVEISSIPVYRINLDNYQVRLDSPMLFIIADNSVINAASVRTEDGDFFVNITGGFGNMSAVGSILKANPEKEYLMLICGPYTCLLSSSNEITYLFRREGSADLPFESGVDYYSKLYNEKLAFSYSTFFQ